MTEFVLTENMSRRYSIISLPHPHATESNKAVGSEHLSQGIVVLVRVVDAGMIHSFLSVPSRDVPCTLQYLTSLLSCGANSGFYELC